MAFENREEFEEEIAAWLDREDLEDRIPGFIRLAEAEFNRKLRSPFMVARCRGTTSDGFTELPALWLEAIRFTLPDEPGKTRLVYKPPGEVQDLFDYEPAGTPRFYTILGRTIQVAPEPGAATRFEMSYYKRIELGTEPGDTNWLLEQASDIYLFGALTMANAFLKHDERVTTWADRLSAAMEELVNQNARAQSSGSPLNRTGGACY